MLDTQIKMEPEIARKHYLAYRRLKAEQRTDEDKQVQRAYLELSRGHAIINAREALEAAGLLSCGRPRLAFSVASELRVFVESRNGSVQFKADRWTRWNDRRTLSVRLADSRRLDRDGVAVVPTIPPEHRPAKNLDRYWLMWEVPEGGWERVPPVDPALLKRINATTFVVLAVWDLTEVERMVLAGRGAGR